jgi:membrane fusion protein (multidrug efflux system)
LGRNVQAGEIVAEIDSTIEEVNLKEQRTAIAGLAPEMAALEAQAAGERGGDQADQQVLKFSSGAAAAQLKQAQVEAESAEEEARRAERLRTEGILATADADRLAATARAKRSAAEALRSSASQLAPELQLRERDREVRLKQILEQETRIAAERLSAQAAVERLEQQIERLRIRAPITGRIAECAQLLPGSRIAEGQQLAVILPAGDMRVVSEFTASSAIGKVRPGQGATVRLQGFPWGQYGTVSARVSKVADEIQDGTVRVELAVVSVPPRIHLQHGIPGTVEVAVEKTTPAAMLLRSAGAFVGGR